MLKTIIWDVEDAQFEFPDAETLDHWEYNNKPVEFIFDIDNADNSEELFPTPHPDADPEAPSEIVRFNVTPENHKITYHRDDDTTVTVTVQVEFSTEMLPDVTQEKFTSWVENHGGWFAGVINLGEDAEPLGDDGGSITLTD